MAIFNNNDQYSYNPNFMGNNGFMGGYSPVGTGGFNWNNIPTTPLNQAQLNFGQANQGTQNAIRSGFVQPDQPSIFNLGGLTGTSVEEANALNNQRLIDTQGMTPEQILQFDANNINQNALNQQNFWNGVGTALDVGTSLFGAYTGFQNLNLAQDALDFQRDSWTQDFQMRRDDYERRLARQESKDEALSR